MDMFRVSTTTSDYGPEPFVNQSCAGASTASLISSRRRSSTPSFDDSPRLTANMPPEPPNVTNGERTLNTALRPPPHERGVTPFAIGLRHISVRVVNFATSSLEDEGHVRLRSDDGDERVGEVDEVGVDDSSSSVLPLHEHWGFLGRPIASSSRCSISDIYADSILDSLFDSSLRNFADDSSLSHPHAL
ncbi:hypothetical protein EI94DRAFT_1801503 [Lactarius quietus]|nr:hypothetical protein EI94DRAFT_1801503 [Lactarius quietus]